MLFALVMDMIYLKFTWGFARLCFMFCLVNARDCHIVSIELPIMKSNGAII